MRANSDPGEDRKQFYSHRDYRTRRQGPQRLLSLKTRRLGHPVAVGERMIFKDFSDFATDVLTRYRSLLAVSSIPVSDIKVSDDHAKLIGTSAIVIAIVYWLTMLLSANHDRTLAVVMSALILLGLIYVAFF